MALGNALLGYSVAPEMFVPCLRAANISRALWRRGRLYCWLTQGLGRSMAGISFLRPASIAADTRIVTGGPSSQLLLYYEAQIVGPGCGPGLRIPGGFHLSFADVSQQSLVTVNDDVVLLLK
jgi:hypothetical protein